jgi:hypothetical protein
MPAAIYIYCIYTEAQAAEKPLASQVATTPSRREPAKTTSGGAGSRDETKAAAHSRSRERATAGQMPSRGAPPNERAVPPVSPPTERVRSKFSCRGTCRAGPNRAALHRRCARGAGRQGCRLPHAAHRRTALALGVASHRSILRECSSGLLLTASGVCSVD